MAKILVVDDDPQMVANIKEFLKMEGHDVITALSGEEGLDKVQAEIPDLTILDVMMPGMDGFEVARTIRKVPSTSRIPILMLTGIKGEMGLDFKKEAGDPDWLPVNDYCDKPVSPGALISKVNHLLSQSENQKS